MYEEGVSSTRAGPMGTLVSELTYVGLLKSSQAARGHCEYMSVSGLA